MRFFYSALLRVIKDNITTVPADALITVANSYGAWRGGVDKAIQSVAQLSFHNAASTQIIGQRLQQGQTLFINGRSILHTGRFSNVIFIIDDHQLPLSMLVSAGIERAYQEGLLSVTVPLMRTGLATGQVEKTFDEVVEQMLLGIKQTVSRHPDRFMVITIVVFPLDDPQDVKRKNIENRILMLR